MYTLVYTYIHLYTHIRTNIYTHIIHTSIHITHIYYTHIYIYTHIRMYKYIHIYTYTYIYTSNSGRVGLHTALVGRVQLAQDPDRVAGRELHTRRRALPGASMRPEGNDSASDGSKVKRLAKSA